MVQFPKLEFQLNTELDKWVCNSDMFYDANSKDHPYLAEAMKLGKEARKKLADEYVDAFYRNNNKVLTDALVGMKQSWVNIEKRYFEAVAKIFPTPWPEGKYMCYLSIFNRNPRFIETKEFQVYYKHPSTTNYVCAHEMLHFAFYDYIENKFSKEIENIEKKVVWKLSEVFNDVVLRLPEFVKITGQKDPPYYAENSEELKEAIKLWKETRTVEAFVTKYLDL